MCSRDARHRRRSFIPRTKYVIGHRVTESTERQSRNQTNREGAKDAKADAKKTNQSLFPFASSFALFAPSRFLNSCQKKKI